MLSKPSLPPPGCKAFIPPKKPFPLHAMLRNTGFGCVDTDPYDWDGRKRGRAEFAIFQYTFRGHGLLDLPSGRLTIGPGDGMLLHVPGDNRYRHPAGWPPWEFVYVTLWGPEALRIWHEIETRLGPIVSLDETSAPVQIALKIYRMGMRDEVNSPFQASALAYELMMALGSELCNSDEPIEHPAIQKVIHFCRSHFSENINVEVMAQVSGYSRFHFTRLFTSVTGLTPLHYLHNIRITEAMRLLNSTNLSIKQIASACGFSSASRFGKCFHQHTGCSPRDYRKSGA